MRLDALIFGGGAAGLWLLDRLSRDGHHVLLLEAHALGAGQTVASQGVIQSGLKYIHAGSLSASSKNTRKVADVWRDSLLGKANPNLSNTRLRSGCCYLWQSDPAAARNVKAGTGTGLKVMAESIADDECPLALAGIAGTVTRVAEQVIAPRSLVQDLALQYRDRILKIDVKHGLEFELTSPGEVAAVRLTSSIDQSSLELHPRQVIFTAGSGNARLRKMTGLSADVMQGRTLHMVLARGNLPELNGHCVDGGQNRMTITSEIDDDGRIVWQIGGRIAEEGVVLDAVSLTERVQSELSAQLPGIDLRHVEWSTYTMERAEAANGNRPDNLQVLCAGNVTTGWPTKLVLAPVLAQEIANRAASPYISTEFDTTPFTVWPQPEVAELPWNKTECRWWNLAKHSANQRRRAG